LQGEWARLAVVVTLPPGSRRVMLVLHGRDASNWAGCFGAKFASASLSFVGPGEAAGLAASSEAADRWQARLVGERGPGGVAAAH